MRIYLGSLGGVQAESNGHRLLPSYYYYYYY